MTSNVSPYRRGSPRGTGSAARPTARSAPRATRSARESLVTRPTVATTLGAVRACWSWPAAVGLAGCDSGGGRARACAAPPARRRRQPRRRRRLRPPRRRRPGGRPGCGCASTGCFAGARPHDVAPAPMAASGTRRRARRARLARPAHGEGHVRPARQRLGAARRDRRARTARLDHRRRVERDRPRRPHDPAVAALPAARRPAQRQPQHGRLRQRGILWFTGQTGVYGRLDPATRRDARSSTRRAGAARTASPSRRTGESTTPRSPAATSPGSTSRPARRRRSTRRPPAGRAPRLVGLHGRIWVSEWNAGQVGVVRPADATLAESGSCPGGDPQAYAVYVDETDRVWLTDFGAQRARPLRPRDREFDVPAPSPAQRPPDPRPRRARSGAPNPATTSSSSARLGRAPRRHTKRSVDLRFRLGDEGRAMPSGEVSEARGDDRARLGDQLLGHERLGREQERGDRGRVLAATGA